jgi:hypothetical protein
LPALFPVLELELDEDEDEDEDELEDENEEDENELEDKLSGVVVSMLLAPAEVMKGI